MELIMHTGTPYIKHWNIGNNMEYWIQFNVDIFGSIAILLSFIVHFLTLNWNQCLQCVCTPLFSISNLVLGWIGSSRWLVCLFILIIMIYYHLKLKFNYVFILFDLKTFVSATPRERNRKRRLSVQTKTIWHFRKCLPTATTLKKRLSKSNNNKKEISCL